MAGPSLRRRYPKTQVRCVRTNSRRSDGSRSRSVGAVNEPDGGSLPVGVAVPVVCEGVDQAQAPAAGIAVLGVRWRQHGNASGVALFPSQDQVVPVATFGNRWRSAEANYTPVIGCSSARRCSRSRVR
jgi:hypothetical protein